MKRKPLGAKKHFKFWRFELTTWSWKQSLEFSKYEHGMYINWNIFQIRYDYE